MARLAGADGADESTPRRLLTTARFCGADRRAILDRVPTKRQAGVVGVGHRDFVHPGIKRYFSFERPHSLRAIWLCLRSYPVVSGFHLDAGVGTHGVRRPGFAPLA